jgi:hypothetical protein
MKGETPSYPELAVGRERSTRGLWSFGPGIQQEPFECGGLPPPLTGITTLRKLSRSLRPAPEARHKLARTVRSGKQNENKRRAPEVRRPAFAINLNTGSATSQTQSH